ncbi:MAG TPA: OmpA family protein [Chitinophagaceae bacterium]|nr:OmpA family protein [Chitinophagaceae bacterium]
MRKCLAILSVLLFCFAVPVAAQKILKTIERRAKQKAEQRVIRRADQAMDKGMNEVEKGIEKEVKGDGNKEQKKETGNQPASGVQQDPSLFTSKYDFVPGEKVLVYEDFSRASLGDFPSGWNTDAAAEVVTVTNKEGKWLKIAKQGTYYPEIIKEIPDNMTLEFYVQAGVAKNNPSPLYVNIGNLSSAAAFTNHTRNIIWGGGQHGLQLQFVPGTQANAKTASSLVMAGKAVNADVSNKTTFKTWDNVSTPTAHVALWRQATRLRVYVNGEKVWDLPRAFEPGSKYNAITFTIPRNIKDEYYLLSNVRMAVGAPDTRNKLLTEGKFVTHGILFDSGSDKIKPESYGVLKEIAGVLNENPSVRVKVVGHTDSDGDDQSNLLLSQRRAAAVKTALADHFGVKVENLETEGKGESEPADKANTPEAKAANRRVVFVKL